MPDPVTLVVVCFEYAMAAIGCVLLWRHVLSPAARARLRPSPVPKWDASPADFMIFLVYVVLCTFALSAVATTLGRTFGIAGDAITVVGSGGAQLGMLLGILIYRMTFEREPRPVSAVEAGAPGARPAHDLRSTLKTGAATFLMALPVVMLIGKAWEVLLKLLGMPAQKQDLIEMFLRAESALVLVTMIVLAVFVAPVTEELLFRARIFRFCRTRLPRPVAFLLPALLFASLHVSWTTLNGIASLVPLLVLAVVFSAAYERTGNIGTAIVAHALFNLNTVIMIFAGIAAM